MDGRGKVHFIGWVLGTIEDSEALAFFKTLKIGCPGRKPKLSSLTINLFWVDDGSLVINLRAFVWSRVAVIVLLGVLVWF